MVRIELGEGWHLWATVPCYGVNGQASLLP